MSFCVLHLAKGNTILSTTIRFGTIKLYLASSASIALNQKQLDLLLNEIDQDAQCIKNVLSEDDMNQF